MTEDKVIIDDADFNFDNANTAGKKSSVDDTPEQEPEPEAKIAKAKSSRKTTKKDLEKQIGDQGKVTAKIIAEARKLAESKKGLDIDVFFTKHKLVGVDVEQLLSAPLNKDGTYA